MHIKKSDEDFSTHNNLGSYGPIQPDVLNSNLTQIISINNDNSFFSVVTMILPILTGK